MRAKDLSAFVIFGRLTIENRRQVRTLLDSGKNPEEILETLSLPEIPMDPDREISLCWQKGVRLISYQDQDYPVLLREIPDPPLVLYVKGAWEVGDQNAFSIVGTRHPSFYGRTQAKRFSGELATHGVTIVSGLARGIDQIAHEAALGVSYGRTVAVLGCGIDIVYPKENERLFGMISERGVLISEYALGTPPLAENFPRRNRIISGLSHGVLVVEAHSRSGSLITAHEALDQGREVFSLPGPVDQLTSRGTHQLIKEGASLVESPEEIFEALSEKWQVHLQNKEKKPSPCILISKNSTENSPTSLPIYTGKHDEKMPVANISESETDTVVMALREEGALMIDEILEVTGLEPSRIISLLLQMEVTGRVCRTSDGKYACTN